MTEHEAPTFEGCIGGHGCAAILGVHPHLRPIDVFLSARGKAPEREPTPEMEAGNLFEPALLKWAGQRLGREVISIHKGSTTTWPWLRFAPDGAVWGADGCELVSAKWVGAYRAWAWGEEGTDDVPEYAIIQETCYMGQLGARSSHVVASIGGRPPRLWTVPHDARLWGLILESSERFFKRHISRGVPPPPDGSERHERFLRETLRQARPELRPATDEENALAHELRERTRLLRAVEHDVEESRQKIMLAIGADAGLETALGKITWKANTKGARVLNLPRGWRNDAEEKA